MSELEARTTVVVSSTGRWPISGLDTVGTGPPIFGRFLPGGRRSGRIVPLGAKKVIALDQEGQSFARERRDADRGSGDGFRIVRDRTGEREDVILADVKNNTAVWVTVWALVAASAAAIVHAIL